MSTKIINCCQLSIFFSIFVNMKRFYSILFIISILHLTASAQEEYQYQFAGKCGLELKEYLHKEFCPSQYVEADKVWNVFRQSDVNADGSVLDRFSTNHVVFPSDQFSSPANMTINHIVDLSWWTEPNYIYDLYNILPCNIDVPTYKRDYMPGEVVDTIYSNGGWASGWIYINSIPLNVYSPPRGYEGDFARIIMYMATVYSTAQWAGQGVNFFLDGAYPTLNGYSKKLLLQWHALDPVSEVERHRNDVIFQVQYNRNPYVDFPHLVDYIWGEKSTTPYYPEYDEDAVKMPLRAIYSISTDKKIDLYSPYIPTDATWTIDGVAVESESIETNTLGLGEHELRFESTIIKGKLKIKIVE